MKYGLAGLLVASIALAIFGIQCARRIAPIDAKTARLATAVMQARGSLSKFRQRLEKPGPNDKSFFVRAEFKGEGKDTEYLWLNRVTPAPNGYKGRVAESPYLLPNVKRGDEVVVPEADVVDWTIVHTDGTREGNFTQGLEPHR